MDDSHKKLIIHRYFNGWIIKRRSKITELNEIVKRIIDNDDGKKQKKIERGLELSKSNHKKIFVTIKKLNI